MTRVTFGVAVKQNAIEHAQEYPLATEVAQKCFYVDDCLTGADDPELMGQLPAERVTPTSAFHSVGVDYAGPFQIKFGSVRKPMILKAYICLFVCLAMKAIHLELVSDLTSEAFIAAPR